MTKQRTPGLGAIFLIVFLDLLGFSIVLPFLAEEARDTFHVSESLATLLGSSYSLMQFLFLRVWGRLSDRVGRRPVLIWSVLATGLAMSGLGFGLMLGSSIVWLFAARLFGGIATANLGTASAYIADVTKPEERAKGMGIIGVAFGLGFVIGPAIGGILSPIEIAGRRGVVPCFVAAALSALNLLWAIGGLSESLPPEKRAQSKRSFAPLNMQAAREAFALPGVALAVLLNFLVILCFTVLDQTFRFFNKDVFALTALQTGLLLAFIGVMAAITQGGVLRPLAKRYGERPLIRVGIVLQVAAFALFAAAPSYGRVSTLLVAGVFLAVGNGLSQPSIAAYVSKRADERSQGSTLGTSQSAASLARVFGPATGGMLYDSLGPRWPYAASALGLVFAFFVALALAPDREGAQRKTSTQTS